MNTLLITYDLMAKGQDYSSLHKAIQSLGDWWHCLDSIWIVKTQHNNIQARDYLKTMIDGNDKLLVVDITGKPCSWLGLPNDCATWLQNNL